MRDLKEEVTLFSEFSRNHNTTIQMLLQEHSEINDLAGFVVVYRRFAVKLLHPGNTSGC
jgi:hypothetical protein